MKRFNIDYDLQPYTITAILDNPYIDDIEKRVSSVEYIVVYIRHKNDRFIAEMIGQLMLHPEITIYQRLRLSIARMKLCLEN